MTRIYTTTFAATGDKETLAATDPGTGKVSLPSGWTPDYEKLDTDPSYRPVGRKEMNGVINEVTAAVGELQQYGFAPWQALTGGWPLNARVVSGGIVYKSTAAANTAVPPAAPWVMDAAADINSAPAKPVLADADELGVTDSANSFGLVKVTWANLKGQLAGTHNKIINGNFGVNQRAVSGTVVLTAGQYGHDRFKAGASGCIYTFATSANVTTLTISAGSLVQVIEGINLFSGSVVLSWAGTAQGKIGGGSYGVSGVLGTATGGTNMSVEFGTGTLSKVQLEYGVTPSVFEHRPYGMELALCQRYFAKTFNYTRAPAQNTGDYSGASTWLTSSAVFTGNAMANWRYPQTMRATPSIGLYTPGSNATYTSCFTDSAGNYTAASVSTVGDSGVFVYASVATVNSYAYLHLTANAEL